MLTFFIGAVTFVNIALFGSVARAAITYFLWERANKRKVPVMSTNLDTMNQQLLVAFGECMTRPMDWGNFPPTGRELDQTEIFVLHVESEDEL